jgi:Phosphoesterase family
MLFVAVVALLSLSVAASASTLTIPMPSGGTVATGTDLPTASNAYNAPWQAAPAGYSSPSNGGLGVHPGQIGHVWVIVLENHSFNAGFTPLEGTQNTYEATLPSQGALLTNYYGTGHSSLDNYLSMVSGQAPVSDTQDDCPSYNAMKGSIDTSGTPATNSDYGQFVSAAGADAPPNDNGCVYPSSVKTIFNQLGSTGKTWKVYAQDVDPADNVPDEGQNAGIADCGAPESSVAAAPTSGSGSTYNLNDGSANSSSQYVPKHNPLAWFDSLLPTSMGGTGGSDCADNLAPLFGPNDQLYKDLQKTNTTPDFSYIVPDNCSNGHDAVCAGNNLSGMSAFPKDNTSTTIPAAINNTGGTYSESAFLSIVVPEIEASPAFKQNGLIVVDYDEAYPPFTYSSDSQANSQLQPADAYGSLLNDEAGETLYGRSLNWEPTGPNATIVTSPVGQVLTAGPGDSADIDRPTAADGALVACNEPALDSTESATGPSSASGTGSDAWVNFTAPNGTNGSCIPGFQANTMRASKTTPSLTVAAGSSTVPYTSATEAQEGMSVKFNGTAPTLVDTDAALNSGGVYTGAVYVGSVTDTAGNPSASSGVADTAAFTLIDDQGNPVEVSGAAYTGTLTLTTGADSASDPFYNAFDATTGGGDSGAVLISPYIKPGTVSNTYYNHYSLLRSLEDIFDITSGGVGNTGYLGFASQPGLAPFGSDVFTNDHVFSWPWVGYRRHGFVAKHGRRK